MARNATVAAPGFEPAPTLTEAYATAVAARFPRMGGTSQVWLAQYLVRTHTERATS